MEAPGHCQEILAVPEASIESQSKSALLPRQALCLLSELRMNVAAAFYIQILSGYPAAVIACQKYHRRGDVIRKRKKKQKKQNSC